MAIFSKKRPEHAAAELKTAQAVSRLAKAVVKAAEECSISTLPYQRTNPELTASTKELTRDQAKSMQSMLIFHEFLFFYLHLVNRVAHRLLGGPGVDILQNQIVPLVLQNAINMWVRSWPEDLKKRLEKTFVNHLNEAEIEYAQRKEDVFQNEQGLYWLLARVSDKILHIAGYQNASDISSAKAKEFSETVQMKAATEVVEGRFIELVSVPELLALAVKK